MVSRLSVRVVVVNDCDDLVGVSLCAFPTEVISAGRIARRMQESGIAASNLTGCLADAGGVRGDTMKYYVVILLLAVWMVNGSQVSAQRLEASNISFNNDTAFNVVEGAGAGSFKWGVLRGQGNIPPRTARHARVENFRVISSADPFERVAILWSGWEGNGGDRAEYWLHNVYKSAPVYMGAMVGQTWGGFDLFRIRLWNSEFFTWQPRAAIDCVYIESAPRPRLTQNPDPLWTDLNTFDRNPNKPGVQMDPGLLPQFDIQLQTGQVGARRDTVLLKRVTGLDNYVDDPRASPFQDDVMMNAVLTQRVNSGSVETLTSASPFIRWTTFDATLNRTIPNQTGTVNYSFVDTNGQCLSRFPQGSRIALTYSGEVLHTPYNTAGDPLSTPPRDLIDDLRDGNNMSMDLQGMSYTITGAITQSGTITDEDAPPGCVPKSPGTLDITFNLQDFGLPLDYNVTLTGAKLSPDTVRWSVDQTPNLCVTINTPDFSGNVFIRRIWGQLTARAQQVPIFNDDLCDEFYTLNLTPINGDDGNWLNVEAYALVCQVFDLTRINVQARQFAYQLAGGGDFTSGDPRYLDSWASGQLIELVLLGDVNGNGLVDDSDLLQVLFDFGRTGNDIPADLNTDGVVDDADLLLVLFNFGRQYCQP